jgi:bifunctional non-homologous end joining protein LigD
MATIKSTDKKKATFTHLDKIFWPDEGYTKGDVIDYYNNIYPLIIKYMKDRPESLFRTPNGIKEKGFFHKDAGLSAPKWVKSLPLYSESAEKEIHYIICNDKPTLLYLANLGCIEMNPWNSRIKDLDRPDYLVLDLDPSEKNTFGQVVEAANVIKEILDKAGAASFPKTSGATGIHVYVPLGAKYTYEQAKDFAHMIAMMAQEQLPGFTSLERSLSKRSRNHIYIDFLQNRKGQTLACAYSLRPKPGATVSTPLDWSEVKSSLHPSDFTFKNIMSRIEKKGDLFKGVLLKGIDMAKCIKKLS